jgi:hypothetical protein
MEKVGGLDFVVIDNLQLLSLDKIMFCWWWSQMPAPIKQVTQVHTYKHHPKNITISTDNTGKLSVTAATTK